MLGGTESRRICLRREYSPLSPRLLRTHASQWSTCATLRSLLAWACVLALVFDRKPWPISMAAKSIAPVFVSSSREARGAAAVVVVEVVDTVSVDMEVLLP